MLKIIKESFNITNNYIVIATPLILFSLISGLYLMFSVRGSVISLTISAILFFLMFAAFLSGWFYMIQKAVKDFDIEKKDSLIFEFPAGVGEYFINIIGMIVNVIILSTVILIATLLIGKKLIGTAGISYSAFSSALADVETMKTFISSLSEEQLIKINAWNMLLFAGMIINYFIIMLYPAAIFFKRKNPFVALWISIKDTFGRKILKNIILFMFIFVLYFIISVLTALFVKNIFVHFILTLINFYYMSYAAILIFNYYYSNFAKIGSEIDTLV